MIAHDAKALGEVPRNLACDTEVAAYLLDPARRGYPLDELAEERGMAVEAEDPQAGARRARARARRPPARAGRASAGSRACCARSSCRSCACCASARRPASSSTRAQLEQSAAASAPTPSQLEREIWELAGEEFMIGSPQQLGRGAVRQARALAQAPRQDRLLDRRARAAGDPRRAPDHPEDRALAGAHEARPDLPRALPTALGAGRPPAHDASSRPTRRPGRLSSINPNLQNIPIRTETGREIRACFVAEPGQRC